MKKKFISIFTALVLVLSLCLVTAGPVVAKGPAGKGNPPELETLTVGADGTTTTSTTTLVDDMWYRFEVSGTFSAGANITADAEYSSGPDTYFWQDLVEKYESSGEGLLELKVDGEFVEWGEYNDEHTYSLYYVGTGSTVSFQIYDIYYPNNSGSLEVKIFATCTKIQDGILEYSATHYLADQPLQVGYDPYGYNYQAHQFNGSYANSYLGKDDFPPYEGDAEAYLDDNPDAANLWYWEYRDVQLLMKWNDAWLSNKDCDGDGILDRHYGFASYIGSGAWDTNHQSGSYELEGETYKWTYFVKIVAAPTDAYEDGGIWYTAEDTEIGPVIWGSFAVLQRVYNDQGTGEHGIELLSPASPGLGAYK